MSLPNQEMSQSPKVTKFEFSSKNNKYCVCILAITEGEEILQRLDKIEYLSDLIDVVVISGKSIASSINHDALKGCKVNSLLICEDLEKIGSQMRMVFAWALRRGYEGVVTINGNCKDSMENIPNFITKLEDGYDYIQGSRVLPGGYYENTSIFPLLSIKFLQIVLMRKWSGVKYTDFTSGIRACSAKMLADPEIAISGSIFTGNELDYYLARQAEKYKYKCIEIPLCREYPATEKTLTKIYPIMEILQIIRKQINIARGKNEHIRDVGKEHIKVPFNNTLLYSGSLFLILVMAFYPGLMSNDSFSQYSQAVNIDFYDDHPPIMAIWWSVLTVIHDSPAGLLVFHMAMLWAALYLLARKYRSNYILLIGLLPFIVNFSGFLWKDIGLAYSWFLSLAILICVNRKPLKITLVLILLFYGLSVRPNALFALLPILAFVYSHEYKVRTFRLTMLTVSTIVIFLFVNELIAYSIFDAKKLYKGPKYVMLHDLSGISKVTGDNYFPESISKIHNVANIIKKYDSKDVGPIFWGKGENFNYKRIEFDNLFHAWKNAVFDNPLIYLELRWDHFKSLLRIGYPNGYLGWQPVKNNNYIKAGIQFKKNILYKFVYKYVQGFKDSFLFSGWFWLLSSILLLLLWKSNRLSAVLGLSSILYLLPYALIGQAPDFRYIYLSIMLVILGVLTAFYLGCGQKVEQDNH